MDEKKLYSLLAGLVRHPFFWLTVLVVLFFSPMLLYPGFSYIDDGFSLLSAKKLISEPIQENQKILFESHIGRVRPVYYLYFAFIYLLVGFSPLGFWFFKALMFYMFLIGVYKLTAKNPGKISLPHFLLIAVFMALPQVVENAYRLGPAEIRQGLLTVWFLVLLKGIKAPPSFLKIFLVNLLFTLAIFTKETSIILLPIFLIYFFFTLYFEKRLVKSKMMWLMLVGILLQGAGFYLILPEQQGYAEAFSFSANKLWVRVLISRLNIARYYLLLAIAGVGSLVRYYLASSKNKVRQFLKSYYWQVIYLAGVVFSLVFVFLWDYQLGRYYYFTLVFIWLYLMSEISYLNKTIKNFKKLTEETRVILSTTTLAILFGLHFFIFQEQSLSWFNNFHSAYRTGYNWFRGYQISGQLTKYLYELPDGVTVYTTSKDYEPIINFGYYHSRFGEETVVIYSQNLLAEENHPESQLYTEDVLESYLQDPGEKVLLITSDFLEEFSVEGELKILEPSHDLLNADRARFWRIKESYQK